MAQPKAPTITEPKAPTTIEPKAPTATEPKAPATTEQRLENLPPMPGLEVVGRGVILRPYQPYGVAITLFPRDRLRAVSSKETEQTYGLPVGYEVNDSPPFPNNESINQVVIEESFDRFEKHMNLDANVAVSNAPFSVSATAGFNNRMRADQEAYYAMRSSFVPLWAVYVPDPTTCIPELQDPDVPVPFAHNHRRAYDDFFQRFGTHYVRRAWVGGKSTLVLTVLKSSQLSKEEIHAGIKGSFAGVSAGVSGKQGEDTERLKKSSQCTVFGRGGDEVQLAAMSSLDEQAYNKWLETIRENPQVIELEVAGIWTLVRNAAKAQAIMEAYKEAVTFVPIRAAFDVDKSVYFIRGGRYIHYDKETKLASVPKRMNQLLPGLEEAGFVLVDATFRARNMVSSTGESLDRKVYVFSHNRFIRYDIDKRRMDDGYPKLISEGFPGVTFPRVDASLAYGFDTVYFFFGTQYVRFNTVKNHVDEGYPQNIKTRWSGVTFDRIDATAYWGNGKAYFFRGDQHIRYDLATYRADPGYPKNIVGNYVEDWKFIED